jgi:hypothetical protein
MHNPQQRGRVVKKRAADSFVGIFLNSYPIFIHLNEEINSKIAIISKIVKSFSEISSRDLLSAVYMTPHYTAVQSSF